MVRETKRLKVSTSSSEQKITSTGSADFLLESIPGSGCFNKANNILHNSFAAVEKSMPSQMNIGCNGSQTVDSCVVEKAEQRQLKQTNQRVSSKESENETPDELDHSGYDNTTVTQRRTRREELRMEANRLRARDIRKKKKIQVEQMKSQIVHLTEANQRLHEENLLQKEEIRLLRTQNARVVAHLGSPTISQQQRRPNMGTLNQERVMAAQRLLPQKKPSLLPISTYNSTNVAITSPTIPFRGSQTDLGMKAHTWIPSILPTQVQQQHTILERLNSTDLAGSPSMSNNLYAPVGSVEDYRRHADVMNNHHQLRNISHNKKVEFNQALLQMKSYPRDNGMIIGPTARSGFASQFNEFT